MPIAGRMLTRVVALWLLMSASVTMADEIFVAVASNFTDTLKTITKRFEATTCHKVHISVGATGKQYAQIRHGAPFDLFFTADSRRPELLESEGFTQPGSRFTYALGKLVLWSPLPAYVAIHRERSSSRAISGTWPWPTHGWRPTARPPVRYSRRWACGRDCSPAPCVARTSVRLSSS